MKTRILLLTAILSPILTLQAIVDTNDNALSDLWEKQHNDNELFPETFDPEADPDSDGWTNAEEAAAGTDPSSTAHPLGYLQPETVHLPETWVDTDNDNIPDSLVPASIQVSWPTIPGKHYTFQSNVTLAPDNWINVGSPFIGTGTVVTYGFFTSAAATTFWRVNLADIDSDGDYLSDAEENQIGSNSQLRDSDGDGVEDGLEVINQTDPNDEDSDDDFVHDGSDADPKDDLVNWEPTHETAYILVDVDAPSNAGFARDLNDKGEVLFDKGIATGGTWIARDSPDGSGLAPAGTSPEPTFVTYEIDYQNWTHFNDHQLILGHSHITFTEGPASGGDGLNAPCFWPKVQSSPSLLLDTAGAWSPYLVSYSPIGVSTEGIMVILMRTFESEQNRIRISRYSSAGTLINSINMNGGFVPTGTQEVSGSGWVVANLHRPATSTSPSARKIGLWKPNNDEVILPDDETGIAGISDLPNSSVAITSGSWDGENYVGRVYLKDKNGVFQLSSKLSNKKIRIFSGNGTGITNDHCLWRNGELVPLGELCSGYKELLGSGWNLNPIKANNNGVYLIQADGPNGEQKTKLAVPFDLEDNSFATGVDDVSRTADKTDPGWQEDFWIMAPSGKTPAVPPATEGEDCKNDTHFFIPLQGDSTHFRITPAECSITSPNPFPLPAQNNKNSSTWPMVTWHGTAANTTEPDTSGFWSIGKPPTTWQAASLPVKVKVMKRRNVKVICYMVRMPGYNVPILTCGEAHLESTLNEIFARQINAWFDVEIKTPTVYEVDYDVNNNLWMNATNADGTTAPDAKKITDEVPRDNSGDIHIYYTNFHLALSNAPARPPGEEGSAGVHAATPKGENNIFVGPWTLPSDVERTRVLAHEIGHVMCGDGHPDMGSGKAPLDGTDRLDRLMNSDVRNKMSNGRLHKNLLVKKEWDEAEKWLRSRPNGDN